MRSNAESRALAFGADSFLPSKRPRSAATAGGQLQRVVSNLSSFAEVQRMPLIVFDDELSCSPGGLVHVLHKANPISLQRVCRRHGIVRFKVEVEVFALIYELDGGVLLVYEFQVKELAARPNTCVKVLILELERQSHLGGVKTD